MIENVYMSNWTDIRLTKAESDSDFWWLSNALAKKHYKNVHLVTDSIGAKALESLGWSSISVVLDDIPDYQRAFWSIGKLYACLEAVKAGKPFVHIDHDVFLWNALPKKFSESGIISQSDESFMYYGYPMPEFFKEFPSKPVEMTARIDRAYNCGIMGGHDLQFWAHYLDTVLNRMVINESNRSWWTNASAVLAEAKRTKVRAIRNPTVIMAASICEQYMLAAVAAYDNKPVATLFDDSIRPMYQFKHAAFPQLGYMHLCNLKLSKEVQIAIAKRRKENNLIWP